MRILWFDADENPWLESDAWNSLASKNIELVRVANSHAAQEALTQSFDLIVLRAEQDEAIDFLPTIKAHPLMSHVPVMVLSSSWKKSQFKTHSKSATPADRYAKVPMPVDGFVEVACELTNRTIESLTAAPVIEEQVVEPVAQDANADDILSSLFSAGSVMPTELGGEVSAEPPQFQASAPVTLNGDEVDTLKKYLHIREQEINTAVAQKQEFEREYLRLQEELAAEQDRSRDLARKLEDAEVRIAQLEEKSTDFEKRLFTEKETLEFEQKHALEKIRGLEALLATANEKYDSLKQRVRKDLHQIRIREKDLEARLDIVSKDSETLLSARDKKILELQRKIDAIEFDLDMVQDRRVQAEMAAEKYVAKLTRVAQALRLSLGMIEDTSPVVTDGEELDAIFGGAASENPQATDMVMDMQAGMGADISSDPTTMMSTEPVQEEAQDLAALASDGDATRVITAEDLQNTDTPDSATG